MLQRTTLAVTIFIEWSKVMSSILRPIGSCTTWWEAVKRIAALFCDNFIQNAKWCSHQEEISNKTTVRNILQKECPVTLEMLRSGRSRRDRYCSRLKEMREKWQPGAKWGPSMGAFFKKDVIGKLAKLERDLWVKIKFSREKDQFKKWKKKFSLRLQFSLLSQVCAYRGSRAVE